MQFAVKYVHADLLVYDLELKTVTKSFVAFVFEHKWVNRLPKESQNKKEPCSTPLGLEGKKMGEKEIIRSVQ